MVDQNRESRATDIARKRSRAIESAQPLRGWEI